MGSVGIILFSIIGFGSVKKFVKHAIDKKYLLKSTSRQSWLWRNTFVSLVHSCITAFWTVNCYINDPILLSDLIDVYSDEAIILMSFSAGYFIYDFIDIILHDKFRQWEVLAHHVVVLIAYYIMLTNRKYIGFGLLALLVEFNSIFLHIRRMMKLANLTDTAFFEFNKYLNFLTVIGFRIGTSVWMVYWMLTVDIKRIPAYHHYVIGLAGMVVITATNIGLMYRLLQSDYKQEPISVKQNTELEN